MTFVLRIAGMKLKSNLNGVPAALQKIVLKALSKPPAKRYSSAREMSEELNECWLELSHPAAQTPEPFVPQRTNDPTKLKNPDPPLHSGKQSGESEGQRIMIDIRPALPPAPAKVKAKTKQLGKSNAVF
jgi:serine/threonine protein kinase